MVSSSGSSCGSAQSTMISQLQTYELIRENIFNSKFMKSLNKNSEKSKLVASFGNWKLRRLIRENEQVNEMRTKWTINVNNKNLDAASLETSFGQTGGFVGLVLEEAKTSENRK